MNMKCEERHAFPFWQVRRQDHPAQQGRSLLQDDGRKESDGELYHLLCNDLDGEEIKTVLRLDEYNGEDEGSWLLLEAIEVAETDSGDAADESADEE